MKFSQSPQFKTGLFVLLALFILAYATVRISQTSFIPGGSYTVYLVVESASGISNKTPVEISGIQVGSVEGVTLMEDNKARVELKISKKAKLSSNVEARIKATGFLGDTFIELYQPGIVVTPLKKGESITKVVAYGDVNSLMSQLSEIAVDIKSITTSLKSLMAGDDSSFARSLKNIEQITESLKNVSTQNEGNLNALIANLKEMSVNLNHLVARNSPHVDATLDNIEMMTDKMRKGEGTIGRLINDEETVDKLNESIDNLNELLGGANKMQVDLGYHTEYLGTTDDFKHYIALALKPKPDKAFLFEFVSDPAPDSSLTTKNTEVTSGGVTTNVTEEIEITEKDKFRISAQFAKKYYGFTFRGGLIESSGGVGIDYDYGPLGLKMSAFDLETKKGERPHLKAMGTVNVTKSFYLLGGMDDFISQVQDPDWFMGAGLSFTDEDVKSIIGLAGMRR